MWRISPQKKHALKKTWGFARGINTLISKPWDILSFGYLFLQILGLLVKVQTWILLR